MKFPYEWGEDTDIVPEGMLRDLNESLAFALLRTLGEKGIDIANVVLVFVLSGGMEVGVELLRILERDYPGVFSRDFVVTRTYPGAAPTSNEPEKPRETVVEYGPKDPVTGKDVVVIDDMADSSRTLAVLKKHFKGLGANSLTYVTRIVRGQPGETKQEVEERLGPIEYAILASFTEWIEGDGLDLFGKKRGQSYLSKVPAQT